MPTFEKISILSADATQAFDYLCHPSAFTRLNPPWEKVTILQKTGGIENGASLTMRVQLAPAVWTTWHAIHEGFEPGRQFVDRQVSGPFAHWVHTHRIEPDDADTTCRLIDHIVYALPFAAISGPIGYPIVRQKLRRMFQYRHALMQLDLQLPAFVPKVYVANRVRFRHDLIALLQIKGATICQYPDEQPHVALLANGELPGKNLSQSQCVVESALPPLPVDFQQNVAEKGSAIGLRQQQVYQAYWALAQSL